MLWPRESLSSAGRHAALSLVLASLFDALVTVLLQGSLRWADRAGRAALRLRYRDPRTDPDLHDEEVPTMTATFEVLGVEGRDALGEGPWWDVARQRLWWVDIRGRRIRNATLDGVEREPIVTPSEVGFAIPDAAGGVVAGLADGLVRFEPGRVERSLWSAPHDSTAIRINDGKTDRRGRVWFGTMHRAETAPVGSLFRRAGGSTTNLLDGITTSNGLGWSPDSSIFYYTDSMARTIWAFDYDPDSGDISNRRVFTTDQGYYPDGLTVDSSGAVWAAKWNGGRIVRYRPDGTVDHTIELPVRKPTSLSFSGPQLDVLAVTSANIEEGDGELAGSVFLLDVGATGIAEVPADIAG
jgi:L-arabinonolactonase